MKIKYNKNYHYNWALNALCSESKVKRLKSYGVKGYSKKTKEQLLKEIDACKSLSQLFALIQHEGIVMRMYGQTGASNLTPKKLTPNEIIEKNDTPFERLRVKVREAVMQYDERTS